ncbi:MAG: hypothetical protein M1823_003047 [Watsoniomyces obsoletus]|nr:MAG: hypothetical protein M1823_003047 [Watsoniomyces obsoletus]
MSFLNSVVEKIDLYIANIFSGWTGVTTAITLSLGAYVAYNLWTWEEPDTHPLILARQCSAAPIRSEGESAVYRSLETPHGHPLRSGLGIKDEKAPRWGNGRDGDLRDIWRTAVAGVRGQDGQPTGQKGKIFTVRGKEEIVEHDWNELCQEINIIGQEICELGGKRVAIYLPNSVEMMNTIFAGAFYGFTPILLPYRQSLETVIELLKKTNADVLIAGAGTVPLAELVDAYPPLNYVIWVVQRGSRHLDWNEVPEGFGGKVGVAVWHDLIDERKPNASTELPPAEEGSEAPGIVTIWQKKEDDAGEVNEFTQGNVVAAIAALISSLPLRERFSPSDLLLPADTLDSIYPLTLTLAALYSHASIALNSVAGPRSEVDLASRLVSPTIIIASAESISRYHAQNHASISGSLSGFWYWLQSRTLAAGRMPKNALIAPPVIGAGPSPSSTAATPGKLRLLFISERAHTDCPPLSSAQLSDLRIFTGARVVYALTAPRVGGAVAATNLYDYRREEEAGRCSHFGVPMSSLEVKLLDTEDHRTTDEGNPKGEIYVKGPAVLKGETKLGIIGMIRDDHTLAYV